MIFPEEDPRDRAVFWLDGNIENCSMGFTTSFQIDAHLSESVHDFFYVIVLETDSEICLTDSRLMWN